MTPIRHLGWTALALFALAGCEPATPPAAPTPVAPPASAGDEAPKAPTEVKDLPVDPKKEGASLEKPLTDEQVAEIKKLPADEQPIALAQKVCPVSNEPLGGEMGVPIKQKIGDTTFYICCGGCEKKVQTNPDAVLASLAKLKK